MRFEGAPQPRDERLEGRQGRDRPVGGPDRVDDPLRRQELPAGDHEQREHGALAQAAEVDVAVVDPGADVAEDVDRHPR